MSARAGFSWSRVSAVFLKELVQMRRDRLTFAILLAMPVMQLLLFGYAINTDPRHMPAVVEARYARRGRPLEIAQRDDLARLERFVAEWVAGLAGVPVIPIDAAADDCRDSNGLLALLSHIDGFLGS